MALTQQVGLLLAQSHGPRAAPRDRSVEKERLQLGPTYHCSSRHAYSRTSQRIHVTDGRTAYPHVGRGLAASRAPRVGVEHPPRAQAESGAEILRRCSASKFTHPPSRSRGRAGAAVEADREGGQREGGRGAARGGPRGVRCPLRPACHPSRGERRRVHSPLPPVCRRRYARAEAGLHQRGPAARPVQGRGSAPCHAVGHAAPPLRPLFPRLPGAGAVGAC